MDIFVIKFDNNIDLEFIKSFKKKEMSNSEKLLEHCFSYFMLDKILYEKYDIKNREIEFRNRKPFLKTDEKFFSISHSGKFIALAFSDYDCGIDIEQIKPRKFDAISKRMNFKSNTLEEFYSEWTQFEAAYKLSSSVKKSKEFQVEDYKITAVSSNLNEAFEIFVQN